jgi:GAF domain-containing protein
VDLVLWDEARQDWLLPGPAGGRGGLSSGGPASAAGGDPAAPVSVLRYLRRTQEPLAVSDATSDDRFARDPYFDGVSCCSLLAVPVLGRGALRAVLLLENRLIRGAFTTGRLEAVGLIAGQLAVSLDNAQLYAEYRRIADEQAALRRVATLVARAEPPDAVFATVATEAGQLLAVDFAALIRYDDEAEMMEIVGRWTAQEGVPPMPVGARLPLGGTNVGTLVFRTHRAARTYRADATGPISQIAYRGWGWQSAVGVPVSAESRLWGVLLAGSVSDEVPPPDSETRLSGFAELVSTAIANAEARAEVAASRAHHRRRRPGASAHRTRPARRRPAAAGLTGAVAARGADGGSAGAGRAARAAGQRCGQRQRRAGGGARDRARYPSGRPDERRPAPRPPSARPALPGSGPAGLARRAAVA